MATQNHAFNSALGCKNPVLTAYQHKIKQHIQLMQAVKTVLPATLAEHVVYCVLSGKKLLIYLDAEEWLAQLESFQAIVLSTLAHENSAAVESVQIRLFSESTAERPPTKAKLPSQKNIELLRENLESVKDAGLKQALARLNQTLERLSK